jgi:tape measure domain-containing protein
MSATLDARLRLDSSQFDGGLNRALRESNAFVGKMSAQFGTLRNVMGVGVVGGLFTGVASSLLESSMQAEKLEAAMSATAGNAALGKRQLAEVRSLSGDIGLNIGAAAKSMIQFQSAGMSAAESLKAIRTGYNAVVSTGGGSDEFGRFSVAIQQLRASPKPLQEEINQLREALPTTAKLMQEAFGATRAEDIQKLNISGQQFVETLLKAMEKLPQMGDTLEKQIARTKSKFDEMMAKTGDALRPFYSTGLDAANKILDVTKQIRQAQGDLFSRVLNPGLDPAGIRAEEEALSKWTAANANVANARAKMAVQAEKDAATRKKSIEQGLTLAGVFNKLGDTVNRLGREFQAANEAERIFEEGMRNFSDQEQNSALQETLDRTRAELGQAIQDKRERQGDAFNEFVGPQQMTDDERDMWREQVARQGMGRSERKSERRANRELDENIRKAADKKTREQMREIKDEQHKKAFDDLKQNKFFNEEATKKNLKDLNRKSAEEAVKKSAATLTDIRDILKTIATA